MSIVDAFENAAILRGASPALILESGECYNYCDLLSKVSFIAEVVYGFIDTESNETTLVAVMTERNASFIVAMFGILTAGAAYVPVDPAFPPDRQLHILNHSKCAFLIIDENCMKTVSLLGVQLPPYLKVDTHGNILESTLPVLDQSYLPPPTSMQLREYRSRNCQTRLAYVLYTSGSTGKPKGVMVKSSGVMNIINWFARELGVNVNSRVLGLTTFCFDISVLEMLLPLTTGGTLVMCFVSTQKDPFRLISILKDYQVNICQATPTTYEMMLATGWTGDPNIDFLVGGEACRESVLLIASNSKRLLNVYGPTETTIWSSCFPVTKQWVDNMTSPIHQPIRVSVPIGKPISQTCMYIVTIEPPYTQITDVDVEGELWIGGIGVAQGYIHAPDLTQQRFLINPFTSTGDSGGMVYRTGDIVKRNDDNNLIFVGRMDDQVKVGGYRIELQEIESVYMKHDSIEQAVAQVRSNNIVLYIKLRKNNENKNNEVFAPLYEAKLLMGIHAAAARSLTKYMMPKQTVVVECFPQTANGKLDRKMLPDPPPMFCQSEEIDGSKLASASSTSESLLNCTSDAMTSDLTQGQEDDTYFSIARIICNTIQELRGQRFSFNASLAQIGVDSLGSIILLKQLSNKFGGIALSPTLAFSPGMTVLKLALVLQKELLDKNPQLLESLRIPVTSPANGDVESNVPGAAENYVDEDGISDFDKEFADRVAGNRGYIDGIRGALTVMVLWDHFAPITRSKAWGADVAMFVMLTGFTTSLQLRESPRYIKKDGQETTDIAEMRTPFDCRRFLFSRLLGLFPMLWIMLFFLFILAFSTGTGRVPNACYPLYVIGMQTWWISCGENVYFGSILINLFLLYGIFRLAFSKCQEHLLRHYGLSSPLGELILQTSFNRPCKSTVAYNMLLIDLFVLVGLLFLGNYTRPAYNTDPLMFAPYFLCGTVIASFSEVAMYSLQWNGNSSMTTVVGGLHPSASLIGSVPMYTFLWRHFADFIWVAILISLWYQSSTENEFPFKYFSIPILFMALYALSLLQTEKDTDGSLSHYFLQTRGVKFLGTCSLGVYLCQEVIIYFYLSYIWEETHHGTSWSFGSMPIWLRLFSILVCIICSKGAHMLSELFASLLYAWYRRIIGEATSNV